ncbi:hypothetical protein Bpfe_028613, partial [Biomphalaria pfeifferi]
YSTGVKKKRGAKGSWLDKAMDCFCSNDYYVCLCLMSEVELWLGSKSKHHHIANDDKINSASIMNLKNKIVLYLQRLLSLNSKIGFSNNR